MDEEVDSSEELILSLCWDASVLSAVYYDLTTLQLHVIFQKINPNIFESSPNSIDRF